MLGSLRICLVLVAFSGCSSYFTGSKSIVFNNERTRQLDDSYTTGEWRSKYDTATSDSTRRYARNQIINNLVWVVDKQYSEYEKLLFTSDAFWNTTVSLFVLGTTAAATVAGGEQVKAVLAAVATGVAGSKEIIDKNYFAEQTKSALIAKMRAVRNEQLIIIEEGKTRSDSKYPLEAALIDIQAYLDSGTIVSAIQSVHEEATRQNAVSHSTLKSIRMDQSN